MLRSAGTSTAIDAFHQLMAPRGGARLCVRRQCGNDQCGNDQCGNDQCGNDQCGNDQCGNDQWERAV
jgi:uncharacterized low-complexity protein